MSMPSHKPHATSQPSHFAHKRSLTAQLAQPLATPHAHATSWHQHWRCKACIIPQTLLPRDDQPASAVYRYLTIL